MESFHYSGDLFEGTERKAAKFVTEKIAVFQKSSKPSPANGSPRDSNKAVVPSLHLGEKRTAKSITEKISMLQRPFSARKLMSGSIQISPRGRVIVPVDIETTLSSKITIAETEIVDKINADLVYNSKSHCEAKSPEVETGNENNVAITEVIKEGIIDGNRVINLNSPEDTLSGRGVVVALEHDSDAEDCVIVEHPSPDTSGAHTSQAVSPSATTVAHLTAPPPAAAATASAPKKSSIFERIALFTGARSASSSSASAPAALTPGASAPTPVASKPRATILSAVERVSVAQLKAAFSGGAGGSKNNSMAPSPATSRPTSLRLAQTEATSSTPKVAVTKTIAPVAAASVTTSRGASNAADLIAPSPAVSRPGSLRQPSASSAAPIRVVVEETERVSIAERRAVFNAGFGASTPTAAVRELPEESERVSIASRIDMLQREADERHATSVITLIAPDPFAPSVPVAEAPSSPERGFRAAKNDLQLLLERLRAKDPTFTEVVLSNTAVMAQREDSFAQLSDALHGNPWIISMELCNVNMKDSHCESMCAAWASCSALQRLNIETNMLSGAGIEVVAEMAETHPSLQELRLANQRLSVGIEAERALANCLSQNTRLRKLSHSFREPFVALYVDKYLQRNLDLLRRARLCEVSTADTDARNTLTTAYPFPAHVISAESVAGPSADAVESPKKDITPPVLAKPTQDTTAPVAPAVEEPSTETLSIAERLALLRREKERAATVIPEGERMNMTVTERLAMLRREKDKKPVPITDSERVDVAGRIARLKAENKVSASNTSTVPARPAVANKVAALGAAVRLDALLPGAKLPPKLLARTVQSSGPAATAQRAEHDLTLTWTSGAMGKGGDAGDGSMRHMSLHRPTSFRLRTCARSTTAATRGLASIAELSKERDLIPQYSAGPPTDLRATGESHSNRSSLLSAASAVPETDDSSPKAGSVSGRDSRTYTCESDAVSEVDAEGGGTGKRRSVKIDLLSQAALVSAIGGTLRNSLSSNNSSRRMSDEDIHVIPTSDINHLEPQLPITERRLRSGGSSSDLHRLSDL